MKVATEWISKANFVIKTTTNN